MGCILAVMQGASVDLDTCLGGASPTGALSEEGSTEVADTAGKEGQEGEEKDFELVDEIEEVGFPWFVIHFEPVDEIEEAGCCRGLREGCNEEVQHALMQPTCFTLYSARQAVAFSGMQLTHA